MKHIETEKSFRLYLYGVYFGIVWFHVEEIDFWLVKRNKYYTGTFNNDATYYPV